MLFLPNDQLLATVKGLIQRLQCEMRRAWNVKKNVNFNHHSSITLFPSLVFCDFYSPPSDRNIHGVQISSLVFSLSNQINRFDLPWLAVSINMALSERRVYRREKGSGSCQDKHRGFGPGWKELSEKSEEEKHISVAQAPFLSWLHLQPTWCFCSHLFSNLRAEILWAKCTHVGIIETRKHLRVCDTFKWKPTCVEMF